MSNKAFTEANSTIKEFKDLQDQRSTINRRHLLGDLIVMSVMAVRLSAFVEASAMRNRDM